MAITTSFSGHGTTPDDGYYYKQLLDPARGREGRRYYVVGEPQNELEVALVSYIVELTIPDGGV